MTNLLDSPALEVTVATSEKSSAQSWLLLKEPPDAFSWAIAAGLLTEGAACRV